MNYMPCTWVHFSFLLKLIICQQQKIVYSKKACMRDRGRESKPITKRLCSETVPRKLRSNRERATYYVT
jgi:hypothetical protein